MKSFLTFTLVLISLLFVKGVWADPPVSGGGGGGGFKPGYTIEYLAEGYELSPQAIEALKVYMQTGSLEAFINAGGDVRYLYMNDNVLLWGPEDMNAFFGSKVCRTYPFSVKNAGCWEGIDFNDRWMLEGIRKGAVYVCPNGVVGEWEYIPNAWMVNPPEPNCLVREQYQLFGTINDEWVHAPKGCYSGTDPFPSKPPYSYGCTVKVKTASGKQCTLILPTVRKPPVNQLKGCSGVRLLTSSYGRPVGGLTVFNSGASRFLGCAGGVLDGYGRVQTFCNDVSEASSEGVLNDGEIIASGVLLTTLELNPFCNLRGSLNGHIEYDGIELINGEKWLYNNGRWTGDTFYYKSTACRGDVWYPNGAGNCWSAWSEGVMGMYENFWSYAEKCKDHPAPGLGIGFGGPTIRVR